MEIEGTVWNVMPVVRGTSARGEWMKQDIIVELPGEFNRKVCVGFWGDKAQDAAALQKGENVTLSVNVESKEYNGRWYTEVRAWKMTRKTPLTNPSLNSTPEHLPPMENFSAPSAQENSPQSEEVDDLPF